MPAVMDRLICTGLITLLDEHTGTGLALDGKTVRNTHAGTGLDVQLSSTMRHDTAVVIAPMKVLVDTTEVTQIAALLNVAVRSYSNLAVERTFAFGMYVYSLVVRWYALPGHRPEIVTQRRIDAPWYLDKTGPSFADMLTALRRTIIAARSMPVRPAQRTSGNDSDSENS